MLKFHAQILCSNSVLPVLSFSSSSSLDHYFLSIFHWLLLSIKHSALVGITYRAQRTGGDYLSIFPVSVGITHYSSTPNTRKRHLCNSEIYIDIIHISYQFIPRIANLNKEVMICAVRNQQLSCQLT